MISNRPAAAIVTTCLALLSVLVGCAAPAGRVAASQSQPADWTVELREAHRRTILIAQKIDDKVPLTAEDWAQTLAMIGSADWRVRVRA